MMTHDMHSLIKRHVVHDSILDEVAGRDARHHEALLKLPRGSRAPGTDALRLPSL